MITMNSVKNYCSELLESSRYISIQNGETESECTKRVLILHTDHNKHNTAFTFSALSKFLPNDNFEINIGLIVTKMGPEIF